ncbi:MAG: ribonuclease R [Parachlamydia sp.]|jgi:ribonuclease R|nr:ribonuclease R [Parachlamydia sp.]
MVKTSKKSKKNEIPQKSGKETKLYQNLLRITEQFMGGKGFSPLTLSELMQRLSLPEQHETIFLDVLHQLVSLHLIEHDDSRYSWKKSKNDIVSGIIRMHPRGFGFVQLEDKSIYEQDIFIPKHLTKNAVDGDEVEVLINPDAISDKGPEGKVLAILSRARSHLAGIIRHSGEERFFTVYVPLLGAQQKVVLHPTEERELQTGDRVVMEVVDWGSKETETVCRFSHYLGNISDPSCDVTAAIEEFEIRADFPTRVVEEATAYGKTVALKDIKQREDLRHLTTFTIDPDTAKDFDDALSLSIDEEGNYHLGVHIADVSHYVHPGTALDAEAQIRCNSTYFPGICIPMLPGGLSENLCSLKPNVNRLTVSVLMRFDPKGTLIDYRFSRSVIKSQKRFTYREAKKVIDGEKTSPYKDNLDLMVQLCRLLKQKRYERGSIEFALPELVVLVNENGVPTGTDYVTYDITHQMVEEFMLKANELVAWDLSERGKNLTYRVHEVPADENLRDFSVLATAFGFKLADLPTPRDLQVLFEEAGETTYGNYLASSYIRRMRLAAYSAENIGHYGLSLSHYCHFTSPIRRYVDLVVHRILFGESDDFEYLKEVASRCSEQERISAKAESSVLVLKKLRLLKTMHEQDPGREYQAIITRVKNFGIYFEIIDLLLEGFIHISDLGEDYFVYEEEQMTLRGTRKGGRYSPGDTISVMLQSVDFVVQETKWYITSITHPEALSKKQNKAAPRKKKGASEVKKWARKKAEKKPPPRKKRSK